VFAALAAALVSLDVGGELVGVLVVVGDQQVADPVDVVGADVTRRWSN
jgi:hypothetical protein